MCQKLFSMWFCDKLELYQFLNTVFLWWFLSSIPKMCVNCCTGERGETDLEGHFGDGHWGGRLPLKVAVWHFVFSSQNDQELPVGHRINSHQDVSTAHVSQWAVAHNLRTRHSYQADVSDGHRGRTFLTHHWEQQGGRLAWVSKGRDAEQAGRERKWEPEKT